MNSSLSRIAGCLVPLAIGCAAFAMLACPPIANAQALADQEILKLGVQSEKYGKLETAEKLYKRVLQGNRKNYFAHHRLGVLAAGRSEWKLAIAHFIAAERNGPASVELLNDFGAALYLIGDLETAEKKLRAALTVEPSNIQARNNLKLVRLKREWRYKQQAAALAEDQAARDAIARARSAARIRLIAEAKAESDLRFAKQAIYEAQIAQDRQSEAEAYVQQQQQQQRGPSRFKLPEMKLPRMKMPKLNRPKPKAPAFKLPKINLPKLKMPQASLPDFKLPKFNLPKLKMPQSSLPDFKLPKLNLAGLKMPKFALPNLKMPKMPGGLKMPNLKMPKFKMPEFSRL